MAELVKQVRDEIADALDRDTTVERGELRIFTDGAARAAIRATIEAAIERVRPRGYRSEDLFPSGEWSGRVQAADILRDMLAALDG